MIKVRLENLVSFGLPGYRMYVGRETNAGRFEALRGPLVIETLEPGSFLQEKDALLNDTHAGAQMGWGVKAFLQACCDAAWEIGIYPRQLQDHSSELKATKFHLEDMRKLALRE